MIREAHAALVNPSGPNTLTGAGGLETVFSNIIGSILPLGAIVLFVVLMYGGIKYISAGANPKAMEGAKNILTYGLIGMFILAMAFLILVIIELVTGANVTTFELRL